MKSVPEYLPIPNPDRLTGKPAQLNAKLAAVLSYRWARGGRGAAPLPQWFFFSELLGVRRIHFGYAVNLRYRYYGTQPEPYIVEGYATGYEDGPLTGEGWARSCTCPDFQKRRGEARDGLRGEARCCKHMILFLLLARTWARKRPWMGVFTPAEFVPPGQSPRLREFSSEPAATHLPEITGSKNTGSKNAGLKSAAQVINQ
jgi:hypothetical protein